MKKESPETAEGKQAAETGEDQRELSANFEILHPGDERITPSLTGKQIRSVLKPKERAIVLGETTGITLEEFDDYFFIDGIHVDEALRQRGIGTALYEKALELAASEGKKGLLSARSKREPGSERFWQRFEREGRTGTVIIRGDTYDVLYPSPKT